MTRAAMVIRIIWLSYCLVRIYPDLKYLVTRVF